MVPFFGACINGTISYGSRGLYSVIYSIGSAFISVIYPYVHPFTRPKMKTETEIRELWDKYHLSYQDAKANGRRDEELAAAEICRVLEWVLS